MTCLLEGFCQRKGSKGTKPRSLDQLRRYFSLMQAVFHHWPEAHEVQFSNVEECRKWIQMKAGYHEVTAKIPLVRIDKQRAIHLTEAAIRACGSYAVPVLRKDELWIYRPKSISFASLDHSDFCQLNDAVHDVIKFETGIDADEVLKQHERSA